MAAHKLTAIRQCIDYCDENDPKWVIAQLRHGLDYAPWADQLELDQWRALSALADQGIDAIPKIRLRLTAILPSLQHHQPGRQI